VQVIEGMEFGCGGWPDVRDKEITESECDFNQIFGHEFAKLMLEVAASSEHYLLMDGPTVCVKILLSETLRSIVPPLSKEGLLEKIGLHQLAVAPYTSVILPLPIEILTIPHQPFPSSEAAQALIQAKSPWRIRAAIFLINLGEFSKKTLDIEADPRERNRHHQAVTLSTVTYTRQSLFFFVAITTCPRGCF
jgi:magnesium chelatase family protein